ncbi:wd repeat-containing protein 16 [Lynx pardinus]|uniref:Cilia- and flagella-associated protein 52 n=1 Tax=Lynx pardinus TaxID=191816 RepID=A0A485PLW4_LYNPA|nr:wd repeat-containing protein 16 [Lynx pardinus]
MGFKADIILWDYKKRELIARLSLHKGKIEALAFSPNDLYLVSLGGPDDGSVVVWNIVKREAICGSPAAGLNVGNATTVIFSRCRDEMFVTAGNGTIRVWELDLPNRKIWPTECQTGQMKRIVMCITIAVDDSFFYLGTTTGDILKMNPRTKLLADTGPAKDKFSLGVSTIKCLKMGGLLVGSGAGLLVFCKSPSYKPIKKIQLQGGITSITLRGEGHHFFVGTEESHIYRVNFTDFKETLIATCHFEAVQDVVFPFGTAELFATCAKKDIRVWHTLSNRELLRITVPNMTCHGIDFMRDGKSIISGNVDVISGTVDIISGNVVLIGLWRGCRLWLWELAFSFNAGFSGWIPGAAPRGLARPSLLLIQPLLGIPFPPGGFLSSV